MPSPQYRVITRLGNPGAPWNPGRVVAEFENAKNVGFAEYLNEVGEAFFTITQGDLKLPLLTDNLLTRGLHVEIRRGDELMWGGWVGDLDENETDVIFYCYSYVSGLFWLLSNWNQSWSGEQINTIVGDLWTRAKTDLTNSGLAWVTTGTIETPVTTSGGATPIVLPEYSVNYKRILFAMQELVGMAMSDTTNRVVFEITPSGTFQLFKNKGTTITDQVLEFGGNMVGFSRIRAPLDRRNVIRGVGTAPRDVVLRKSAEDGTDANSNSRREEPLFYSWIRDEDEMDRVNAFRLKRGLRMDDQLALSMLPGSIVPARATGSAYELADMIRVRINNGITQIDEDKLVTGQQVVVIRGIEHVRPIVQDRL